MKSAPTTTINTPDILQGESSAPMVRRAVDSRRVKKIAKHQVQTILGQEVQFTLHIIKHADIEAKTRVWEGNERNQKLLNSASIDDIRGSFEDGGQNVPAYGRLSQDGIIESADGSRRRKAAIETNSDYMVLVGNLTDDQMENLSDVGNQYKPPSAWEKGRKWRRILRSRSISLLKLSEEKGLDYKTMSRERDTAELPISIIELYKTPNDLSGRSGQKLAKAYKSNEDASRQTMMDAAKHPENFEDMPADAITSKLIELVSPEQKKSAKPITPITEAILCVNKEEQTTSFTIDNAVPEATRKRIEKYIRKQLDQNDQ